MGMGIVLIAFYIQALTVTLDAVLLSVPSMILVGAIMLSNNIRDIVGDTEGGRKTLAILVGRDNAISVLSGFFIVSYLWVIALVAVDGITFWALIIFLSIPKPLRAIQIFRDKKEAKEVMPAMKYTAQTNTFFGFLLGIGLLIHYFFIKMQKNLNGLSLFLHSIGNFGLQYHTLLHLKSVYVMPLVNFVPLLHVLSH